MMMMMMMMMMMIVVVIIVIMILKPEYQLMIMSIWTFDYMFPCVAQSRSCFLVFPCVITCFLVNTAACCYQVLTKSVCGDDDDDDHDDDEAKVFHIMHCIVILQPSCSKNFSVYLF